MRYLQKIWVVLLAVMLVFSFLVTSCSKQTESSDSSQIIPDDTLILILTDIHLADAFMSVKRTEKLNFSRGDLYRSVLESYHIPQARFDSTIHYYTNHIEEYEAVYEVIMQNISQKETEAHQKQTIERKELRDSLTLQKDTVQTEELNELPGVQKDTLRLKKSINEIGTDTDGVSEKEFIQRAREKRNQNEEKRLRAKKAPRL